MKPAHRRIAAFLAFAALHTCGLMAADGTPPAQAPFPGYSANRQDADRADLDRLQALTDAAKIKDAAKSAPLLVQAAACWPPTPEAKRAALLLAKQRMAAALSSGQVASGAYLRLPGEPEVEFHAPPVNPSAVDAQTLDYLISSFDATGDRTCPFTTALPDNQPLLNRIATPTDDKLLAEAIALVGRVSCPTPASAAPLWRRAELRGLRGDAEGCARDLLQIADQCPDSLLASVAELTAGEWLQYAGRYYGPLGAYACYRRSPPPTGPRARTGISGWRRWPSARAGTRMRPGLRARWGNLR